MRVSATVRFPRATLALGLACSAACGAELEPIADAGRAVDAGESRCDEAMPCESIDPSWDEDGGATDDDGATEDASAIGDASLDARTQDAARDAQTDARTDAPAPRPAPTCGTVDARLRDDFGIVIRPGTLAFEGLASEDIGCADRLEVYQMFTLPFAYERYPRRLDPTDAFTMHLYRGTRPTMGSCSAYVPSAQAMQIRDLRQCLASVTSRTDPDFMRVAMFLIHESGHIITARTPSLRTAFSAADLPRRDPRCYDRGFLRTYSLRTTNPVSESFAESLALFIGRRKVGSLGTINDFRTECPNTYEWTRANVFGARL